MKVYFQYSITLLIIATTIGCKSYSKYTIDEKPLVKIDTGLYGIWKAIGDTDKADYIFVENYYDVHYNENDKNRRLDQWDLNYTEYQEKKDYYYYITRMDDHGRNLHYQQWSAFISKINNAVFLNIPYRNTKWVNVPNAKQKDEEGYFFVRLIKINSNYDTITTAIVADSTLRYLTSSKELRKRITKNINAPAFYSDTLHFYKVSNYHQSLKGSIKVANP